MARHYGICPKTFRQRLRHGVSVKDSLKLERPPQKGFGCFYQGKVFHNISELALEYGVSSDALKSRLKANWPLDEALELRQRKKKNDSRSLFVDGVKYRSIKEVSSKYRLDPCVVKRRFLLHGSISAAVSPIYDMYATPLFLATYIPVFFNRKIFPSVCHFINDLINKGVVTEHSLESDLGIINRFVRELNIDQYPNLSEISRIYSIPAPTKQTNFNKFVDDLHRNVFGYEFDMLFHSPMGFILNCDAVIERLHIKTKRM
ncbi:hypothetical protein GCM10011607_12300 [Shewanella inventionis]|uniref:Uncharacterized protein n=1 Tax=Shewanella inventionis TaxID=1738770 RepID=A0ABQ1IV83_9GAMM|nr:hypothetical protein [Shewanella inventionis]GGB53296.1 hypothetical protein GCM10011607_12300 [Shewanella inventionis]